jgi:hypothetical protein
MMMVEKVKGNPWPFFIITLIGAQLQLRQKTS